MTSRNKLQTIASKINESAWDHRDLRDGNTEEIGREYVGIVLTELGIDYGDVDEMLSRKANKEVDHAIFVKIWESISMEEVMASVAPCPTCGNTAIAISAEESEYKNCMCTICEESSKAYPTDVRGAVMVWNDHCDTWNRINGNSAIVLDTEIDA